MQAGWLALTHSNSENLAVFSKVWGSLIESIVFCVNSYLKKNVYLLDKHTKRSLEHDKGTLRKRVFNTLI